MTPEKRKTQEVQRMLNNAKIESEWESLLEFIDNRCNNQQKSEWAARFQQASDRIQRDIEETR